jgi:hypothetical protein
MRHHEDVGERFEQGEVAGPERLASKVVVVDFGLVFDDVEGGAAYLAPLYGVDEVGRIDDEAPREADVIRARRVVARRELDPFASQKALKYPISSALRLYARTFNACLSMMPFRVNVTRPKE